MRLGITEKLALCCKFLLITSFALVSAAACSMEISTPLRGTAMALWASMNNDTRVTILLNGDIDDNAARDFDFFIKVNDITEAIVYLNSQGGTLQQALALGELIRKYKFDTNIGIPSRGEMKQYGSNMMYEGRIDPGVCVSACVYTYAGGVGRFWTGDPSNKAASSWLGLHQFYLKDQETALQSGQVISATLVTYLAKMGIDTLAFSASASTKPNEIMWLDEEKARLFNFVNNGFAPATAEVRLLKGTPLIFLEQKALSPSSGNTAVFVFSPVPKEPNYVLCRGAVVTNPTASKNMLAQSATSEIFIGSKSFSRLSAKKSMSVDKSFLWIRHKLPKKQLLAALGSAENISVWANTAGVQGFPAYLSLRNKSVKQKLIDFLSNLR